MCPNAEDWVACDLMDSGGAHFQHNLIFALLNVSAELFVHCISANKQFCLG